MATEAVSRRAGSGIVPRSAGALRRRLGSEGPAGNVAHPLEIGWGLRPDRWGRGYATEAARAMGGFAFDRLAIPALLAVAVPENTASCRVMERLGMRFRGIEPWYEMELATYEITVAEWRAQL